MSFVVYIGAFDDLEFCQEAVATVPDGTPVHIFDGRHADFPGEYDLTPGLADFCGGHPDCTYHRPPDDRLPFGSMDAPGDLRTPGYEKASWVFGELPQDTWCLKMDTDEQLVAFDIDLSECDENVKIAPKIDFVGQRKAQITRLIQPQYWTPWIGDCFLPREIFPRGTPVEALKTAYSSDDYRFLKFVRRVETDAVTIFNRGPSRPESYQRRRLEQLEHRGRDNRWDDLKTEINQWQS